MGDSIKILLYTHIMAGVVSLVVAPIAMVVHKGGKAHRRWGKLFFWAMTWVFASAVVLSVFKWIPFLLMIAVFSYYSVFMAYRSLYQKQLHRGKGIRWYDWTALIVAGVFNLFFVGWGIYLAATGQEGFFAYLAIGFGAGGCVLAYRQLVTFVKPPDQYHWFYNHIGNMIAGYIASVTAFSTQVMYFMPGFLQWLWPSLVGVPLIIYWIRSYRRKLEQGARITDLVELNVNIAA